MADIAYLWYFMERLKSREEHTWFHDAPRKISSFYLYLLPITGYSFGLLFHSGRFGFQW